MAMYTPPTGLGQALHLVASGISHIIRFFRA
jgi:hypothetical protein